MATSSSTNFSVSCQDIVESALRKLGAIASGETPTNAELQDGREALNLLIKQWMAPQNAIAPGLKIWQRESTTLTLSSSALIELKPSTLAFTSGGTYEISVGDTITGATSEATATVIAVSVSTGTWADGDAAGNLTIRNQSGTFEAENLDVGTDLNEATIAADSSQAGGGKDIPIPIKILSALRRNTDNNDTPLNEMIFEEYEALPAKSETGTPTKWFYDKQLDVGNFRLNYIPSDTTDTIVITYLRTFEDLDALTDDVDFPQEWYRALVWNLAVELCPEYGKEPSSVMVALAMSSLAQATSFHPETTTVYFQPNLDY